VVRKFRPPVIDQLLFIARCPWSIIGYLFLLSFFVVSCGSVTPPAQPQTVTVYASPSVEPWMGEVFACGSAGNIMIRVTADAPDVSLRLGDPDDVSRNVYQIGEDEVLVVVNRESSLQNLSLREVQALFAGQADEPVQVWVFPSELDISGLFDQFVMEGRSVTSFARIAVSPDEMSEAINSTPNAIGVIPARWGRGDARAVYSAGNFPVLALTSGEPQGAVRDLLTCLQP